jgi:hypothetical protein
MKKDFVNRFLVISIFWLLFFLAPVLVFMFPFGPTDIGWFVVYFIFIFPALSIIILLLEIFFFNKKIYWKIVLLKYFILLFLSYATMIVWFYYNIKINPFLL